MGLREASRPRAAQTEAIVARITEAHLQSVGAHAGVAVDPVDLVSEGAVENTGVIGADGEFDVRSQKTVDWVGLCVGYGADTQVGGGASFDNDVEFGQAVEHIVLAAADRCKPFGIVGAVYCFVAGQSGDDFHFFFESCRVDGDSEMFQFDAMVQVVADLRQALASRLGCMGLRLAGDGDGRVEAQRGTMAKADRAEFRGLVAPAHGAFQRLVEIDLADVVGYVECAAGAQFVVAA